MGRAGNWLAENVMSLERDNSVLPKPDALLAWIQQLAPFGVVTLDESFLIQSWNRWMELHSSLRSADVVGKSLFELFPDLRQRRLVSPFERALQGESSMLSTALHRYLLPLPSTYREAGASDMLQTARIAPLFSDGKISGIVLVIEDVTQRENQAKALEKQHHHDELLSWALAHLLKSEQPRKEVRQLFFKIVEQLDFDTFMIYLQGETERLSLDASGGIPVELEKDFRDCPFLAALPSELNSIAVLDSVQTRRGAEFAALQKAGISAAVVIPLVENERKLGLLCLGTWSRELIGADELELIDKIAQFLAVALHRENTNQQLRNAKEQLSGHAELLERRVQERTARMQEVISELETFSYTIAHDLRAPVRGMTGFCEVLLEDFRGQMPAEATALIQRIARASDRMNSLTRDLLEFSKVSREEVILSRVEIEPLIEELTALRPHAVRNAIHVKMPLIPVCAHKSLLQHIFSNLIDNAVKFVNPGAAPKITIFTESVSHPSPNTRSGALTFSATEFTPPATRNVPPQRLHPNNVRIWIADEGIGISPQFHQKIFGIFERGVTSDVYEGTGIGLAIVARAVQRMGGTCGVESELGKGSRFWLELAAA